MSFQSLQNDLADQGRQLLAEGLLHGSSGQVSARLREAGSYSVVLKASRQPMRRPESYCRLSPEGEVVEPADARVSLLSQVHCGIYRRRDDVDGVAIGKAVFADTVTRIWGDLPDALSSHWYWVIQSPIKVLPLESFLAPSLREFFLRMAEEPLIGTFAQGTNAVVIPNMVTITVGADTEEACDRLRAVEAVSRGTYYRRLALGSSDDVSIPDWLREITLKGA